MKLKHYIGLFFMLLMLGSAVQPIDRLLFDTDIELSDGMNKDSKDSLEKELKSDLIFIELNHLSYAYHFDNQRLNVADDIVVIQHFEDIILPPPEC
jgi:hypothetical protein